MKKLRLLLYFWALFFPQVSHAHPVSFKGGYGVMPSISKERSDLELNYSIENSFAVGVSAISLEYEEREMNFILPQFNYKLFRKNELESQANLYLSLGGGVVHYEESNQAGGLIGVQADYETRRVYTLVYAERLQAGDDTGLNRVRYRLGFAPYLAEFEDLHTWVIGQVEYTPEMEEDWTITPMIRLFYQNYLVEFGVSTEGAPFFAGIFHF